MSLDYEKSENCQRELIYASEIEKPIFFVTTNSGYNSQNWLHLIRKGAQYHDLTGENKEEAWNTLLMQIKKEFASLPAAVRMELAYLLDWENFTILRKDKIFESKSSLNFIIFKLNKLYKLLIKIKGKINAK